MLTRSLIRVRISVVTLDTPQDPISLLAEVARLGMHPLSIKRLGLRMCQRDEQELQFLHDAPSWDVSSVANMIEMFMMQLLSGL